MIQLRQFLQIDQLADPAAIADILLLWFAIYQAFLLIRRTRAMQMVYGLFALVLLFFVTDPAGILPLKAVHTVLGTLLPYGVIAVIVIFQTPIKQALAWFGRGPFTRRRPSEGGRQMVEEIALAAGTLAGRRVGALMVLERSQALRNFLETGIQLDAVVSYDLLINIFSPRTPLHDGAVIIGDGRVKGASCFLPLSVDPYISRTFGTRHRAAIGVTEESDALAIVVSEERGVVSVAVDGELRADLDTRRLRTFLEEQWLGPRPGARKARRGAPDEAGASARKGAATPREAAS